MRPDEQTRQLQSQMGRASASVGALAAALLPVLFDPEDPLASLDQWASRVSTLTIRAGARTMALAQHDYMRTRVATVGTPIRWVPDPPVPERIKSSLLSTSGQTIMQGLDTYEVALKRARIQASGVAIRHSMNAARNSTIATVKTDPDVIGAVYLTRGDDDVCSWCMMLASRGPVFKEHSFWHSNELFRGEGTAKSHDFCRCVIRVVGSEDAPLLAQARDLYENGWLPATKGHSGRNALNAWRRHVYAQRKSLGAAPTVS